MTGNTPCVRHRPACPLDRLELIHDPFAAHRVPARPAAHRVPAQRAANPVPAQRAAVIHVVETEDEGTESEDDNGHRRAE